MLFSIDLPFGKYVIRYFYRNCVLLSPNCQGLVPQPFLNRFAVITNKLFLLYLSYLINPAVIACRSSYHTLSIIVLWEISPYKYNIEISCSWLLKVILYPSKDILHLSFFQVYINVVKKRKKKALSLVSVHFHVSFMVHEKTD